MMDIKKFWAEIWKTTPSAAAASSEPRIWLLQKYWATVGEVQPNKRSIVPLIQSDIQWVCPEPVSHCHRNRSRANLKSKQLIAINNICSGVPLVWTLYFPELAQIMELQLMHELPPWPIHYWSQASSFDIESSSDLIIGQIWGKKTRSFWQLCTKLNPDQ